VERWKRQLKRTRSPGPKERPRRAVAEKEVSERAAIGTRNLTRQFQKTKGPWNELKGTWQVLLGGAGVKNGSVEGGRKRRQHLTSGGTAGCVTSKGNGKEKRKRE